MLAYIMLLYEDLIRKKLLTSSGKLPPVVPIVLYNGVRPWTAPLQVAELIESVVGTEHHLPRFEYLVIDEGRLSREQLEPLDSPVVGVFQLEQSTGVEELRRIIDGLIEILDDPELRELRRDMATWLRRAVFPARFPEIEVPELQDLQEAKIMLAERAATWPSQWRADGRRETLAELIEEKFGPVETRFDKLMAKASEDQLKRWLKRILTAATADEVFDR